jgi:predicted PurR-regulated permease PerM
MVKGASFELNRVFLYLIGFIALSCAFLYQISGILFPFIVAIVISYFFAPFINLLERKKISRGMGAGIVIAIVIIFITLISVTVIPLLYKQIAILVNRASEHQDYFTTILAPNAISWLETYDPELTTKIKGVLGDLSSQILGYFASVMSKILQSSLVTINIISLVFIAPIVLFYLLRDWKTIMAVMYQLIPGKFKKVSTDLFAQIDLALSGYIIGQMYVCLTMALYYSIGLSVIGLESGLALGLVTGVLTFIPYVGSLFSAVLCCLIASVQFGSLSYVAVIIILFAIGQFLEGHFIVPKFIGDSIDLHPVWVIFGLLAGGALVGFTGVLIALPATAVLSVVIKFSLERYYKSKLYL